MDRQPEVPGPRARFPGQLILAFRADPLGFLAGAARTYGDFCRFRVGPMRYFLLNDPEGTRDVLVTQAGRFTKSPALRAAKVTLGEGLLTSEGDFHRRQRRLSQPAFHPHRVARYTQAMVRRAQQTSGEWGDGQVVDVHEEMMRLTLRIVAEALFSADVDSEIDEIGRAMAIMVAMFRRAMSPFAPVLNRLPLPSNYRFERALARIRTTIDRFVRENRAAGVDRGDLLSTLIRARDLGGEDAVVVQGRGDEPGATDAGMSDLQLRDEIMTLFTAGHETTANALTFTWYLLARHPEAAGRLYDEVDRALGGRPPTADDTDRLPFVRAVLAESMRLYPPAWLVVRQAKEAVQIAPKGYALPAEGVVIMSQWVAHHDPRWWPRPDEFVPDRWLDPAARDARPRYAYFPFGGGPRSCIGEAFAWTEAILVIAALAQRWRMELAQPDKPLRLLPTITLRTKDPIPMRLRQR